MNIVTNCRRREEGKLSQFEMRQSITEVRMRPTSRTLRLCGLESQKLLSRIQINAQSLDIAGGVNAGKDDLDVGAGEQNIKFEYTNDETHSMTVRLEEIDDEDAIVEDRNGNHNVQVMRRR